MEQLRGLWLEFMGLPLLPLYDIAFLYRQRRNLGPKNRYEQLLWQDIKAIKTRLQPPAGASPR